MAASGAPVQMTAESCRAAVADGEQHLQLRPCQMVRFRSMKLLPAARMMSATSRVGRFISSFGWVAAGQFRGRYIGMSSSGLATACRCRATDEGR